MTIEIVSRRGADKVAEIAAPVTIETVPDKPKTEYAPFGAERSWISNIAFMVGIMQFPEIGGLLVGRAARVRNDGFPAMSIVLLPTIWDESSTESAAWEAQAVERLNTYLSCGCRGVESCPFHQVSMQKWLDADAALMHARMQAPLPRAVERLKEFEAEAKATIIRPSGPILPMK
jgi:hypothetical protein